jgi:hypothetical protein
LHIFKPGIYIGAGILLNLRSMRTLLACLAILAIGGCIRKETVQVDLVDAQLVRIDTIERYTDDYHRLMLTWKDDKDIEYVSYSRFGKELTIGMRLPMLRASR